MLTWIGSDEKKKQVWFNTAMDIGYFLNISGDGVSLEPNGLTLRKSLELARKLAYKPVYYLRECVVQEGLQAFKDLFLSNLACNTTDRECVMKWFFNLFLLNIVYPKRGLWITGPVGTGKTIATRMFRALAMGRDEGINDYTHNARMQAVALEPVLVLPGDKPLRMATNNTWSVSKVGNKDKIEGKTVTCSSLIVVEGMKPLEKPELRARFIEVEFSRRYFSKDFSLDAVINNILLQRNLILSAMIKMTAERLKAIQNYAADSRIFRIDKCLK